MSGVDDFLPWAAILPLFCGRCPSPWDGCRPAFQMSILSWPFHYRLFLELHTYQKLISLFVIVLFCVCLHVF